MLNPDYQQRIESAKRNAHGRWNDILASSGAARRLLRHRDMPCPRCGGNDRFRYDDKFGGGDYYCRHCGAGDGFTLLQALLGGDFHTALQAVENYLGTTPVTQSPPRRTSPDRMLLLANRIWEEGAPLAQHDDVWRYLHRRGLILPEMPQTLRFHPALGYYEKDADGRSSKVGDVAAMLARVQGPDGALVTLHRTYLLDGRKAVAHGAKKLLSGGIRGAAVRLFEPTEELAVAEGIETALAVHLATGHPTWAALSAGNLEQLWIPPHVRRVLIYADNDAGGSFTGQAAAFALARRLARDTLPDGSHREIQVFIPPRVGEDWADVWQRLRTRRRARNAPTKTGAV